MKRQIWLGLAVMMGTSQAWAITVDGTLDAGYGPAIAVQQVQTGFGDVLATTALGGSELDAAYATISGGRLYLMLTGNHEPNFNKLEIYFDSIAGGENTLSTTPQYDFSGDGGLTWNSQNQGGLIFDTGFAADFHLFSRWGGGNTPGGYEADFVNRQGGTSAMVPGSAEATAASVGLIASGFIPAGDLGPNASASALTQNLEIAVNNNNIAGVSGCSGGSGCAAADQTAALAVTTGMEFSIALADIGNPAPGSSIRIAAIINNSDHSYLSNQSLGAFDPPQQNPGGNGNNPGDGFNGGGFTGTLAGMDFNNYSGQQFFAITVPAVVGQTGDYNGDGNVNAADYSKWRDNLGAPTEASISNNGDGLNGVDPVDYTLWKSNFDVGPGSGGLSVGSAVPEPSTLLVAVIGLLTTSVFLGRRG